MNANKIRYAVCAPKAFLNDVDTYIEGAKNTCKIEVKNIIANNIEDSESLGFDPITGSEFAWMAFKFAGSAAVTISVKLLVNILYDKYKKYQNKKDLYVYLRFPNGILIRIPLNEEINQRQLEIQIQKNGKV